MFSVPSKSRDSLRVGTRRRAPGNPRRGFPTQKYSTGIFLLPSCAFARKRISLRARSDQRRCLWILPPLKRRAKFYFRADGLQRHSAVCPTESFSYPYNRNSAKLLSGQASKEIIARPARICSAAARAAIHRALARATIFTLEVSFLHNIWYT